MNKQIVMFLLVISVAFNIAFIGMFIWHRSHLPAPPEGHEFPRFKEHMRNEPGQIEVEKREFMDSRKAFMDYMSGEEFDEAIADSMRQEILEKQIKLETEFGKRLIEMRKKGEFNDKHFKRPPEQRSKPQRRRK